MHPPSNKTSLERLIGPLPGKAEARGISILALVAGAICCGLSLYYGFRGETFLGRHLGGDFVEFYAVGKILNDYPPAKIYDLETLVRVEHESAPAMSPTQMLIYGNAPYVGLLFRPLARLPYGRAYCVWLALSLGIYALGLHILFRGLLPPADRAVAFLLAISSPVYLLETWIGGQVSVLAFFAVVLFVRCWHSSRWFLAGLSLALAAYKPTLLVIPGAVLILGASWRALAGLCAGSAMAVLASLWTVGLNGCLRWIDSLRLFGELATGAHGLMRRVKYVDLNSFFEMLLGHPTAARICAGLVMAAALLLLAWASWKSRQWSPDARNCLWAAAFAGTLIVSVYVPIYDTITLIPALALVANVLAHRGPQERTAFRGWLLLFYLVPSLTQSFAEFARTQIFTLLLASFGLWVLKLARSANADAGADAQPAMTPIYDPAPAVTVN